jgi:hypothetical protein
VRINAYRRKGDLRSNIVLKPGPGRNLLDCKVIGEIREDQPLNIAGTYSVSKGTVANGIFTLLIHPDGKQEFKYYSFGNLKHFFSYLPPSVEEKEVERIESKRAKGKRNSYGVNVSIREPLITRDNNIFVGECYSRSSRVYNSYYGWQTGYMYSHAFFVGVNKEGKVVWDNAMPIDRFYESSELQQVILTEFGEQFLSFTYSKNHLLYKVFDDSGKSVQESDFPLTTNVEVNLSALREDLSEYVIRKWYDNHVLIYGVNYFDAGFETARVFFLKKISVEEDKSADQR